MTRMQCAGCGKQVDDARQAPTCPHCGRPLQAVGANPTMRSDPARARRQSALDREFELLCLMDDIF